MTAEQWNMMSDAEKLAYNSGVRAQHAAKEQALLNEAGGDYQRQIDFIDQQIKALKAQRHRLEVEQAKVCKKAWIEHFGDSCGFPTIMRMTLGEVIR